MDNVKLVKLLKQRLSQPLPGKEAQLPMAASFRHLISPYRIDINAGVLLLIYPFHDNLYTVLMKRTIYPGVHSGQISFPGGKYEFIDNNLIATALREAKEEIGINPEQISVLGNLTPLDIPVSKTKVFPVVGFIDSRPKFDTNPEEVDFLIELDIHELFNPAARKEKPYNYGQYIGTIPYFNIHSQQIWGATAMILNEFLEILNDIDFKAILS